MTAEPELSERELSPPKSPEPKLPEQELSERAWLAGMVRAYVGCSVLLTDDDGQLLLVRPNYRDWWLFPGGCMDHGETPSECAVRETREETGLVLDPRHVRLLVVEWRSSMREQGDQAGPAVQFMFDGGQVPAGSRIRLQTEELREYGFFTASEAARLLSEKAALRLTAALTARASGTTELISTAGYIG